MNMAIIGGFIIFVFFSVIIYLCIRVLKADKPAYTDNDIELFDFDNTVAEVKSDFKTQDFSLLEYDEFNVYPCNGPAAPLKVKKVKNTTKKTTPKKKITKKKSTKKSSKNKK